METAAGQAMNFFHSPRLKKIASKNDFMGSRISARSARNSPSILSSDRGERRTKLWGGYFS